MLSVIKLSTYMDMVHEEALDKLSNAELRMIATIWHDR